MPTLLKKCFLVEYDIEDEITACVHMLKLSFLDNM